MKVMVTGRLPNAVIKRIKGIHHLEMNDADCPISPVDLAHRIVDQDGIISMITDTLDAPLLGSASRLKIIANFGVGFNNIDLGAATAQNIMVTNTPGVLTESTADVAMALILSSGRRIVEGDRKTRRGGFRFWAPLHFLGQEISRKTLGIIGCGRIGQAVAKRAAGFDMRILYYSRRRLKATQETELGLEYVALSQLLAEADYISLHLPLSAETRHFIATDELARMKKTACLINTSRGPVVDEEALVAALKTGSISAAGLDVYEHEPKLAPGLSELPNVTLLPHVGSATLETRTQMANMAADNLLAGLRGEIPPNCLNCRELNDLK